MDLGLRGKKALVTGSTRGIGKAIAMMLVKEGVSVVLHGKSKKSLNLALKEFRNSHLKVCGVAGDLRFLKDIKTIARYCAGVLGGVDILVNNAGVAGFKTIEEINLKELQGFIDLNLKAPFLLIKEFLPIMKKKRWGRIINIVSTVGVAGGKRSVHYSLSKGGVVTMTQGLARDIGKYSITANCVAPGLIETESMVKTLKTFERIKFNFEAVRQSAPLNRVGKPDDVASVVLFLASSLADFITGQTIVVNGGSSL